MSYSTNTQCKFDDYHSECFKLIQQLITDRNLILILFLHLGCISLHPQLKKKIQRVFQNIIPVGKFRKSPEWHTDVIFINIHTNIPYLCS